MKKITLALSLLGLLSAAHASNSWTSSLSVTQVLVLETGVGGVAQFSLSNGSIYAFEVSNLEQEKYLDLLRSAMQNGDPVQVNYNSVNPTLTFTPTGGTSQNVNRASGIAVNP